MKFKYFQLLLSALCAIFSYTGVQAQTLMPVNPKIKIGKLDNGLTYYIMPNNKPENKVELRLAVKAGSINEDDSQQGLAHMCEHMAFNGTTRFKKNDIVSYLEDIGVGCGSDLNAYTFFTETVYILPIPTSKPENIEKGFMVLEDWAHNVTYNNDDIDSERGIILEESRTGKGANDRMNRKIYAKLFQGSLYGKRIPIGIDSIIKNFKHDEIKRFYKDWYRPDLMAVIVVGDITTEKAEMYIKKHFAGLTKPATMPTTKDPGIPMYNGTDAIVVTDKEATTYSISLDYQVFKTLPNNTESTYRKNVERSLFTTMFNQRLQELTQKQNPPFVSASAGFGSVIKGHDAFSFDATSGTSDPSVALSAVMTEAERVKRFGFTQSELDRVKKSYLNFIERSYNNRDKNESDNFVEECIQHFLNDEGMPGIEVEYAMVKKMLPEITLKDVNAFQEYINNKNRLVSIKGPETNANVKLPDSMQLVKILADAEKGDLKPFEEKAVNTNLLSKEPKAGKVVSKTINAQLGTTELKLSNGISVTLKKTDFKNDEIIMTAARNGGRNGYGIKDKYNASFATAIVAAMGFGEFTPVDMRKALAGKTATVIDVFSETEDGFRGNSSVKDIETMLQLLQLHVTATRKDTALFNTYIQKAKSQSAMASANPQAVFIDTFYKTMYGNNPLASSPVPKTENYDKIQLDRLLAIHKEHFGDMSGMQFVFVGSIDEAKMIPLIEKYVASLPSSGKKFMYTDNKVRTAKGKINLTTYKGKEEKSLVLAVFSGEAPFSEDQALKSEFLLDVINIRIIEELREKIQGIYGGAMFGELERKPYAGYSFIANLPCGPEKADTIAKALQQEIIKIRTKGIDSSYFNKAKAQKKEDYKQAIKNNAVWANALKDIKVNGDNPDRLVNYEKYLDKITVADLKKAANTYMSGNNIIIATLMPEKYDPKNETSTGNRKNVVTKTIDTKSAEVKIELYDNGDIDGDEVTVYFNGNVVSSKAKLTDKAITINLKAIKGATNELVMFAENLGSIPPNTALMKVYCDGQTYELRIESDEKKNGAIRFNLK
jgi:zinc protease